MSSVSFKELQEGISKALVETTRTGGQLANEDLAFHRTLNPALNNTHEHQNSRLLGLARDLTRVAVSGTDLPPPHLSNVDSVDDNWRGIVDVLDSLLERADACLDEYTGSIKRPNPSQEEQAKQALSSTTKQRPGKAYRSQDIEKPQLQFVHAPANHDIAAFKPLLKEKPHALTSLTESLQLVESEDGSKQYTNPYTNEIQAAQTSHIVSSRRDPIPYLPFDSTTATFVDSLEAVRVMLDDLKQAEEIAIDLEHHDEHSYSGIVSLMQISTRDKDWVIDTLKPWRQDMQILNEVFTDPRIIKVLHGSTMDIIWLQRDLGLYIVGLFDTYHASWALGYPKHSLAFLLKKFVNFDAAKQYQMADWRIRPLPEEMFNYARSDTHFLLYVYDIMRNELIDNSEMSISDGNLIDVVMNNSKQEALQRYERLIYDEAHGSGQTGWYNMLYRTPSLFSREQFAVFRAVHKWRDQVAREEDESINYVLPRKALYSIARELPKDMPALLGCSHPISKPLHGRKHDLLNVIREAGASAATQPEMRDFFDVTTTIKNGRAHSEPKTNTAVAYNSGVGAALAALKPTEPLGIKMEASSFWGMTISALKPRARSIMPRKSEHLYLTLPLPPLSAQVFVDPKSPASEAQKKPDLADGPGARAEHRFMKKPEPNGNDIIVLRDSARSRKRKADNDPSKFADSDHHATGAAQDGDMADSAPNGDSLEEQQNAERKRQKREARLERKRLKHTNGGEGGQVEKVKRDRELKPFDYENAPSVLHTKTAGEQRSKQAAKSANPYAKSLDAPKGLRRMQKEIPGKSKTFRK